MSDEQETAPCAVCRKRPPTSGYVCDGCRLTIAGQLDKLLKRIAVLPLHLAPSSAPPGERVSTSRTGSPTPARLDVLSLIGAGAEVADVGTQRPLVRRWHTVREVDVTVRGVTRTVELPEWHQELVRDPETGDPVMVPDDDQIGVTPPREWLGQQVTTWRSVLGHHLPRPVHADPPGPGEERLSDVALAWMHRYAPHLVVDAWMARFLTDAYRHGRAQLITGMTNGGGDSTQRPPELRDDDALADEWEIRFGEHQVARAPAENVRYLQTWLDRACERTDLDLHRFAAELRALHAELARVLGEKTDQTYLGRCPATVTDRESSESKPCGCPLWQDPFASVVTCPRCRTAHGPRVLDLMRLSADIRRVWPLDRRKRYSFADRDEVPDVPCPKCGQPVLVFWRDVTGTDDGWHTWFVPTGVMCRGGCAEALEVLR